MAGKQPTRVGPERERTRFAREFKTARRLRRWTDRLCRRSVLRCTHVGSMNVGHLRGCNKRSALHPREEDRTMFGLRFANPLCGDAVQP